jgi:hypothetical protein
VPTHTPTTQLLRQQYCPEARRNHVCSLKTYTIAVDGEDILEGSWRCVSLDTGAAFIIPLSARLGGGVLVASEISITHYSASNAAPARCSFPATFFQCWGTVGDDDTRFLLGDHTGGLHLLMVAHDEADVVLGLSLQSVGQTTCGSSITYLDSGVCFIGSLHANSQLVKLLAEAPDAAAPTNFVQVCPPLWQRVPDHRDGEVYAFFLSAVLSPQNLRCSHSDRDSLVRWDRGVSLRCSSSMRQASAWRLVVNVSAF